MKSKCSENFDTVNKKETPGLGSLFLLLTNNKVLEKTTIQ